MLTCCCCLATEGAAHLTLAIEASSCLQSLGLASCGISQQGAWLRPLISSLAAARLGLGLTALDLSGNALGDAGVGWLLDELQKPDAPAIATLGLGQTLLGPQGAETVAAAFDGLPALTELDIHHSPPPIPTPPPAAPPPARRRYLAVRPHPDALFGVGVSGR